MADKKIEVNAKADVVETEASRKKKEEAKKTEAKMQEAKEQAEKAREEAEALRKKEEEEKRKAEEEKRRLEEEKKKEEEEKKKQEEEAAKQKEEMLAATAAAAVSVVAKSSIKIKSLIITFLAGLLVGAVGTFFLVKQPVVPDVTATVEEVENHDLTIENEGFIGYTAADFENAILGEASQHKELIVMEQPLSIQVTITKAGLGNLAVFSKVKNATYYGTGVYTIDLSVIDQDHIEVDEEKQNVTVFIPHSVLQYINPDLEATEFEDTEKGLLAFSDIKLTLEEQNLLEISIRDAMSERLNQEDLFELADRYAVLSAWEIFQPLITSVSREYTVTIEWE